MSKKDEFVRFEDSWFASVGWTEQEYCRFMYQYINFKTQSNIAITPWEMKNLDYFKENQTSGGLKSMMTTENRRGRK